MAPVVRACRARPDEIEPLVCFTGQHQQMLVQTAEHFGIQPDVDLALMRPGQTPADVAGRCLLALDEVLGKYRPHCVVAQGDTSTVLAAGLAAFYRRTPFVHVEAGLRTGNLLAPWPEEMNRRVASVVTTLHCAPTQRAADHLLAEGHAPESVRVTGNTVIDALLWTVERQRHGDAAWREKYSWLGDRRLVLITGHRRENFGDGLESVCHAVRRLAAQFPDVELVYPVHLNPQVREPVHRLLAGLTNVRLLPPADYPEFVWLMNRSTLILTDSGGVQEEAPSLGKPVLVMRDTTERPEALDSGAIRLVGTRAEAIVLETARLLTDPAEYASRRITVNPYGDGRAAGRIVDWMLAAGWHRA